MTGSKTLFILFVFVVCVVLISPQLSSVSRPVAGATSPARETNISQRDNRETVDAQRVELIERREGKTLSPRLHYSMILIALTRAYLLPRGVPSPEVVARQVNAAEPSVDSAFVDIVLSSVEN